jgi:hypothetical protein
VVTLQMQASQNSNVFCCLIVVYVDHTKSVDEYDESRQAARLPLFHGWGATLWSRPFTGFGGSFLTRRTDTHSASAYLSSWLSVRLRTSLALDYFLKMISVSRITYQNGFGSRVIGRENVTQKRNLVLDTCPNRATRPVAQITSLLSIGRNEGQF